MIADVAIHNKGEENPHAHIMLTTRNVTPDGFGLKNTDWNKKDVFVEWRKGWTRLIIVCLSKKDLRSVRPPLVCGAGHRLRTQLHLGFEATKLEKRGIHTRRGDINRERQQRNQERAAQKTQKKKQNPYRN